MIGSRSTGSRSIAFSRNAQTNTVSASGATNLRLVALWTMFFASLSTSSNSISMAAWKRPGTPAVALRAPSQSSQQPSMPIAIEKKTESQLTTEKSTRPFGLPVDRCVRWWTMYSPAVGAWPSAAMSYCFPFGQFVGRPRHSSANP